MSAVHCWEALRIIGKDLQFRGIKTFLIRCEEDLFVVEGGYQSPPAPTAVNLHYTADDIEHLDYKSGEVIDEPSSVRDFLDLSKILWAMALYVSGRGTRLLSISNNNGTKTMPALEMEYENFHGDRMVENLTGSAIYDLCFHIYKRRPISPISYSRYTRFSALSENS